MYGAPRGAYDVYRGIGAPEIQRIRSIFPENRDYGRVTVPDRDYAEGRG